MRLCFSSDSFQTVRLGRLKAPTFVGLFKLGLGWNVCHFG